MKRRLIVMRHAKSSWSSGAESDHERPLNKRGRRDAPAVAAKLAERGWAPDFVLSSDSRRTRETWELMAEIFAKPPSCTFRAELYHGDREAVAKLACEALRHHQTVMLLGHNPGWEELVRHLCGETVALQTANAALLTMKGDAIDEALAHPNGWKLLDIVRMHEDA